MALSNLSWPELSGGAPAAEWATRVDLAAACRLTALYGWDDLIANALSARIPGPAAHILVNPAGLMLEEITASSLVRIDLESLTSDEIDPPMFALHFALHAAREDLGCVIRLNSPDCRAVSAMAGGLLPHALAAATSGGDLAYHDYDGETADPVALARLVRDLGVGKAMVLANHGALTGGASVGEAFIGLAGLQRACQIHIRLVAAGQGALNPPPHPMDKAEPDRRGLDLAWSALLRKLDRIDPGFRG